MKTRRILFGLLALLLLPLLTARADDAAKDKKNTEPKQDKPITVPFEMLKTGHITVMVKVNGKGPYRLIFDTGAPLTLVNNKVGKEAGLLKEDAPKPLFAPFGSMGEAKIETLEVGDQKATNVSAMVMDHPTVQAISKAFEKDLGGPIDGIVGFPFFARFKMTLDYKAKTLTFMPNGYEPPDIMKAMTAAIMDLGGGDKVKILSPAGQWGFLPEKGEKDDDAGVTLKEVFPGGAAAAAGLKAGDRLLTIDGRWTDTIPDLYRAAEFIKPGATAPVTVKRDGKEMTLKVKPTAGL